jgi:hypothetical protein
LTHSFQQQQSISDQREGGVSDILKKEDVILESVL